MYGSVALVESPRDDTSSKLRVVTPTDDGADFNVSDHISPLGSPVGAEAENERAQKRSANAFIPVVCSIFGVIIFMRLGMIVGVVGLFRTWGVIAVAFCITFLSLGSLSALASSPSPRNLHECGFYESMVATVGEHAGRAIGVLLFLSFGVASAYYLLGLAEITMFYLDIDSTRHAPLPWNEDGSWITVMMASGAQALLALVFASGVRMGKRMLKIVFVMVLLSIGCNILFLVVPNASTGTGVSRSFLTGNLAGHAPERLFKIFGEFFPAFCGVMAGVHLADLLMPRNDFGSRHHSTGSVHLILGTHKALGFCCLVYATLSLVLAACVENGHLRKQRFVVQLVVDSILGIPVIYLGIAATTLTSALSNIMSAASMYDTTTSIRSRGSTTSRHGIPSLTTSDLRPTNGFLLAWSLSQAAILCGSVDTIIPLVSSTFLFAFAVVNFACFYHEIASPSFKPTFIMYNKWSALFGFCLSVGALFLVMSSFFVGCMVIGMIAALGYFQSEIPDLVGTIRRQDSKRRNERLQLSQATRSARYSDVFIPEMDQDDVLLENEHSKRIELAALYVRDALHGRFLGEEYVSEGLHKLEYKRWYHALQFARIGNMAVLMGVSFFEVPSWCFFAHSCGEPHHTLVWNLPTLSREVTLAIELLNLGILMAETALKYQYLGKRLYFVNKWHIVQLVLLLSDIISVLLVAFVPQSQDSHHTRQMQPLVLSPILRPLLLLTMSERLRSGFMSLVRVVPRVMDSMFLLLVLIVIYAICGMVLFEGTEEGRQYFPDFETSAVNMLVLLTTANFPDVMMPAYDHARYSSLFFISFLVVGLLLVMNLVFASMYQNYRQEVAQRAIRFSERRQKSLEFAFQLLPGEYLTGDGGDQLKVITRDTLENLISELLRPVVSFFDTKSQEITGNPFSHPGASSQMDRIGLTQFIAKIKGFAARQKSKSRKQRRVVMAPANQSSFGRFVGSVMNFVRTTWFDYAVDVIILGNLAAILFEIQAKIDGRELAYKTWETYMPVFSGVYIVEMVLKMYVHSLRGYFEGLKNRYDCIVTVVILVAEVSIQVHYSEGGDWQWIRVLLLLRFLRCLRLLVALEGLSTMFSIVLRLLPAFTTLYGMLGIVMMEYAAVGVQLFGGKLVIGDARLAQSTFGKSNYYANNFNDFPSALTTLFELLLVNNWNVIMEGTEAVSTTWSRVYFVSYYIIAVVMMLNLVVAFVVEAYFEQSPAHEGAGGHSKPRGSLKPSSSDSPAVRSPGIHDTAPLEEGTTTTVDGQAATTQQSPRLVRKRAAVRPHGDSVYIEEFL